jgi:hypothetical protein
VHFHCALWGIRGGTSKLLRDAPELSPTQLFSNTQACRYEIDNVRVATGTTLVLAEMGKPPGEALATANLARGTGLDDPIGWSAMGSVPPGKVTRS